MSFGQKMHVEFKISINDLVHENQYEKITKRGDAWFSASEKAWGFPYFIKLDDLQNSKSLILRDAMEIELQILSMSMARIKDDFEEESDDDFPSMPPPM
ncbi:TRAF-like protein [Corchorus capsularis]|uniref:TRAF-like protein n=1 Tax=Corchorus capsularis TaxID=210143 RepID=A0A1R3HYS4_COCAP|nr:TRAF-like protein [Corchorus capsularis]